jgi:arylsulfatase A-like enzyme
MASTAASSATSVTSTTAAAGVELARDWIVERDRPWFCFVHVFDPHYPYAAPEPWDTKFSARRSVSTRAGRRRWERCVTTDVQPDARTLLIDYYDGEIAFADAQLGWLLRELDKTGALANTIIVFQLRPRRGALGTTAASSTVTRCTRSCCTSPVIPALGRAPESPGA